MFFFKDYTKHIVNIHVAHKTTFFNFFYFKKLKTLLLLFESIRFSFHILPNMYNNVSFQLINLLFYNYSNTTLTYLNSNYNFDSYYLI